MVTGVSDYKRFQIFLMDKGLWHEFKEKTLENYKSSGISMYQYFNMTAYDKYGTFGQEDLIDSAFPIAQVRYGKHPDDVWANLHLEWVSYLRDLNNNPEE